MRGRQAAEQRPAPEPSGVPLGQCSAYGCPLPGSILGFGSLPGWCCELHSRPGTDHQATTQAIREREALFRLALRALVANPMEWKSAEAQAYIAGTLQAHERDSLIPTGEERQKGPKTWAYRLRAVLYREAWVSENAVFAPRSKPAQSPSAGIPQPAKRAIEYADIPPSLQDDADEWATRMSA